MNLGSPRVHYPRVMAHQMSLFMKSRLTDFWPIEVVDSHLAKVRRHMVCEALFIATISNRRPESAPPSRAGSHKNATKCAVRPAESMVFSEGLVQ